MLDKLFHLWNWWVLISINIAAGVLLLAVILFPLFTLIDFKKYLKDDSLF